MQRGRSQARRPWSRRKTAANRKKTAPAAVSPSESWRLPWGDQLAEFALQAGLVAPLLAPESLELEDGQQAGCEEPAGKPEGGKR